MGCDFSHGDLRMSYRQFHCLVEKLADEAGIPLQKIDPRSKADSSNGIKDPILSLLTGYDEYGGGDVPSRDCLALSRRIWEIADRWSSSRHPHHLWRTAAADLAHAVGEAAFLGENFYWF